MITDRSPFRTHPPGCRINRQKMDDGWSVRTFDLRPAPDQPRQGSLLFLSGFNEFFEKYLESLCHWQQAGWQVSGFDWRGQGGSGRLLANPRIGHIDDYARLIDDLALIADRWRASTPGPHVIICHSMGGHLAMRALAEGRITADAVAMSAPMLGLPTGPLPTRWARALAAMMCRWGLADHAAWRRAERPLLPGMPRAALLTHDMARWADEAHWFARCPELELGPPSWGWLRAALQSVERLEADGVLERIKLPMLLLMAGKDRLVANGAIQRAAARLPHARTLLIAGAYHELLREADGYRDQAMNAIDGFLADVARPPA
jgi:lysophospholipase